MLNNSHYRELQFINSIKKDQKFCKNMEHLTSLINEKYLNANVIKSRLSIDEEIQVTLLNSRHGINQGIDEENKHPIEYLKSFEAKVCQKEAAYSYQSYSVITFDQSKLQDVLKGLKTMPTPMPENNTNIMMAKR